MPPKLPKLDLTTDSEYVPNLESLYSELSHRDMTSSVMTCQSQRRLLCHRM